MTDLRRPTWNIDRHDLRRQIFATARNPIHAALLWQQIEPVIDSLERNRYPLQPLPRESVNHIGWLTGLAVEERYDRVVPVSVSAPETPWLRNADHQTFWSAFDSQTRLPGGFPAVDDESKCGCKQGHLPTELCRELTHAFGMPTRYLFPSRHMGTAVQSIIRKAITHAAAEQTGPFERTQNLLGSLRAAIPFAERPADDKNVLYVAVA